MTIFVLNSALMNMTQKKYKLLTMILLIFIALTVNLTAQSTENKAIITKIKTVIDGTTIRKFLLEEIQIFEGKEFDNLEALEDFMEESTQDLINMRVFEMAEYTLENTGDDGDFTQYTVTLLIRDTWNIYPIPTPTHVYGMGVSFKGVGWLQHYLL